jgi:hypothetical protein
MKKIAVLFTDIIGSTEFFQAHGNLAGRRMLRQHEDIVASTITHFGGTVVKNLGDSVMAYLPDPQEAVKVAIEIQKEFNRYNVNKDEKTQIHIRIGIHFGDGIIEDRDIFGDVVNVASKLTNLAGGDQIFISREVFENVESLSSLQFEPADTDRGGTPKGLVAYRVIWDKSIDYVPIRKTVMWLKPIWELGVVNFDKIWRNLVQKKGRFWGDKTEKEIILDDMSVILILMKPPFALDVAYNVTAFVRENLYQGESQNLSFLPVQIMIDSGAYLDTDKLAQEGLAVDWGHFNPGSICISPSAYELMKTEQHPSFIPSLSRYADQNKSFYEITISNNRQQNNSLLFLYQGAMLHGADRPCFYCGSRKHVTLRCPSKDLSELTGALGKLGYLSFDKINDLYLQYLGNNEQEQKFASRSVNNSDDLGLLAYHGFYELKKVFQLRFFKNIWNAQNNNWSRISTTKAGEEGKGGFVWLAQDCIRVSNLSQAESLLETCLEKYPQDYRVYCSLGFLNIEKDNRIGAEYYLTKAVEHATTDSQKIFILLLLSRLYDLNNEERKAQEKIEEIKYIEPSCPEARYQDIIFKFRERKESKALSKLVELILSNREYYISALIDPDLAPFNKIVHPELKKLFIDVREKAQKMVLESEKALSRFKAFLGDDDGEVKKTETLLLQLHELAETDSYFGYLDMMHHCRFILHTCRTVTNRRKNDLVEILDRIDNRVKKYRSFTGKYNNHYFIKPTDIQLQNIIVEIKEIWAFIKSNQSKAYSSVHARCEEMLRELDTIEPKLKLLKVIKILEEYSTTFLRDAFIIIAGILFVAAVIFPIVFYYLNMILPKFDISPITDMWFYQKSFVVAGCAGGLLLSVFKSFKVLFKL